MSELVNRISGMILLGAYGDAYGAEHETRGHIHDDPFPKRLPARNLANHHWGTWLPAASIPNPATGVPTDDTSYKLFILYPWLEDVLENGGDLTETSFRDFLSRLKGINTTPSWVKSVRDKQINAWLRMYLSLIHI